jgi:hypothetical protein
VKRKTKPIPDGGQLGANRTNKANSGSRPGVSRAKCAKQSQTWALWGIWGSAHPGSLSCQTKPIRPALPGGMGAGRTKQSQFSPRCPGETRSGDAGAGQLYKQSQFRRPGYPTVPLFYHSGPIPIVRHRLDAPLRETNPIWWGPIAPNEPNLRQDSGDEESGRDCVEQSQLGEA